MGGTRLVLWGGVGLWIAVMAVCFAFAGARTALRSRTVGAGALVALLAYIALLLLDARSFRGAELLLFVALLLLSLLLRVDWELWLVRSEVAAVEAQIETGCSGLFITCRRSPGGRIQLTARSVEWQIRLLPLGKGWTCVLLPRPRSKGKVQLLVNWLAKQYPGPFPRPRIRLQRGD